MTNSSIYNVYNVDMLDKEMILILGDKVGCISMEQNSMRFILRKTMSNLKLINYLFWNFPINIFGPQLSVGN